MRRDAFSRPGDKTAGAGPLAKETACRSLPRPSPVPFHDNEPSPI